MADTLKTMPISSLTDVTPDTSDKLVTYRDSDKSAHVSTVGELAEGMNANISDAFSSSKSYEVGDYCIYNDTLYKCTTAHSGSWNASDFEAVTVANELSELNTNIQYGIVTNISVSSQSYTTIQIEFEKEFKQVPVVVASLAYGTSQYLGSTTIIAVYSGTYGTTQKGGAIRVVNNSGTPFSELAVSWIAVGI